MSNALIALSLLTFSMFLNTIANAQNDEAKTLWICESEDPSTQNKPDPVKLTLKESTYGVEFNRGGETIKVRVAPMTNTEFMGTLGEELIFFEYLPDGRFLIAMGDRVVRLNCYLY